jgi:ribose/xylose/arabinose/galactoside ABC-type transport system permease subunit
MKEKFREAFSDFIFQYSQIMILIVLFVGASFAAPVFLTVGNLVNILRQAALLGISSIGMTMVILTGGIDLSVGSVLALLSCFAGTWLHAGWSQWYVLPIILVLGGFVGLLNGIMVVKIGLPPFMATFGMMQVCRGLAFVYMRGESLAVYGFAKDFRFWGAGKWMGIPFPIILLVIIFLIFHFLMNHTAFGWRVYAVGANRNASRVMGINTGRTLLWVYAISSIISSFAGIVYISRLNAAEPMIGETLPLEAVAASVIGGTSLWGGEGTVGGAVIGALITTIILNLMNLLGISSLWQEFVIGTIILGAVFMHERGRVVLRRA